MIIFLIMNYHILLSIPYELKEWVVLNERIGNKVKMIIPPPSEIGKGLY